MLGDERRNGGLGDMAALVYGQLGFMVSNGYSRSLMVNKGGVMTKRRHSWSFKAIYGCLQAAISDCAWFVCTTIMPRKIDGQNPTIVGLWRELIFEGSIFRHCRPLPTSKFQEY